ncbi:MAG: hypothetical protein AB7T59_00275 [Hyphomonadaceae bacterium]
MRAVLFAVALGLTGCAAMPNAASQPASTPVTATLPQWWVDHVAFISRDGGVWVTPNATTDPNAPDAFGMEWRASNEGRVLTGRLYGLRNGQEIAEYWTFREFWHPGEQRAIVQQWGGPGLYGVGESRWENGEGVLDQTFWLPDGRSWREGHRNRENGDAYETVAFDIDAAGVWTPKDARTWRRLQSQ